jgi:hypothetical protein
MGSKDLEEHIINSYKQDEQMMILVFSQWCVNHDLDPMEIYLQAYPEQASNHALQQAIELTVSKEEAGDISDETLLGVLAMFGNEELAFVVTEIMDKIRTNRNT